LTFFPMVMLGYGGMPRRYAGYDLSVGPVSYFTDLHQIATFGAVLLAVGQLAFVWNVVTSWLEGPEVGSDPWDLEAHDQRTNEWHWRERQRDTPVAVADGEGSTSPTDAG